MSWYSDQIFNLLLVVSHYLDLRLFFRIFRSSMVYDVHWISIGFTFCNYWFESFEMFPFEDPKPYLQM